MSDSTASSLLEAGTVEAGLERGIATIRFGHPKSNSLPGALLRRLAEAITRAGEDNRCRVIVLRSEGSGAFCAGASFDELKAVKDEENGRRFFSGFAEVILAMIRAPRFILTRVQGKAAGGAVGMIAASDYALATRSADVRLSELALGLGPFVVGPVIERKIGLAAFGALAVEAGWRNPDWAERHGLFAEVLPDSEALDRRVGELAARLAGFSDIATQRLKEALWHGTESWPELLAARVAISGSLVLTEAARKAMGA